VMHEGILEETVVGSPQGAVISPLLSNIFTSARSVLGEGGEGDEDGPLCRRPGSAVPMEVPGCIHAEAQAVPGAAAGDCQ
jgi:hypothetical protein